MGIRATEGSEEDLKQKEAKENEGKKGGLGPAKRASLKNPKPRRNDAFFGKIAPRKPSEIRFRTLCYLCYLLSKSSSILLWVSGAICRPMKVFLFTRLGVGIASRHAGSLNPLNFPHRNDAFFGNRRLLEEGRLKIDSEPFVTFCSNPLRSFCGLASRSAGQ